MWLRLPPARRLRRGRRGLRYNPMIELEFVVGFIVCCIIGLVESPWFHRRRKKTDVIHWGKGKRK